LSDKANLAPNWMLFNTDIDIFIPKKHEKITIQQRITNIYKRTEKNAVLYY